MSARTKNTFISRVSTVEADRPRVRTGPGKPGKSWKFKISKSRPGKPGKYVLVLESPGKLDFS